MSGNAAAAIEAADIHKDFGAVRAVDGISFRVRPGSIHGLLGRNGAGKTTTLRMLAGVFFPDRGTVRVFGEPWSPAVRGRMSYLPEERGLYRKMRVLDQVVFLARIRGHGGAESRRLAEAALRRFELWDDRSRPIEELSKGNQQKVQLAGVLVGEPDVLLLDEPVSGLDPVNVVLVREVLLELRAQGRAVVLSTHLMHEAEKLCDEVCLIHRGKVVLQGPLAEVRRRGPGRAAVRVEFEGEGLALSGLPGVERTDLQGGRAELLLAKDADTNRLLEAILARVKLLRFEVATPTLEEVFVQAVGEAPPPVPA